MQNKKNFINLNFPMQTSKYLPNGTFSQHSMAKVLAIPGSNTNITTALRVGKGCHHVSWVHIHTNIWHWIRRVTAAGWIGSCWDNSQNTVVSCIYLFADNKKLSVGKTIVESIDICSRKNRRSLRDAPSIRNNWLRHRWIWKEVMVG